MIKGSIKLNAFTVTVDGDLLTKENHWINKTLCDELCEETQYKIYCIWSS